MTLPAALFAVRWLIRDTLRQARASGITAAMLLVTGVCTLLCLSMGVQGESVMPPPSPGEDRNILPKGEAEKLPPLERQGVEVPGGELTLLFGAFRVPLYRTRVEAVRLVQALLTGGVADTAGVLLALVWTAGFLPGFIEPGAASVLLAKPVPRWSLLAGKVLGVLLFVAAQAFLFVAATGIALGISTGVWNAEYFIAIPILIVHFTCFYALSALLAVTTRSTVVSVLGTLAFWLLCWSVNYGHHLALAGGDVPAGLAAAYWLLPKPLDFGLILLNALNATADFAPTPALRKLLDQGQLSLALAAVTSCVLPAILLAVAGRRFVRAEY